MSGRNEIIQECLAFTKNIPTVIATSYFLVKKGTNEEDAVVTAAKTDYPLGRLNAKTSAANEAGQIQPLVPGQRLKFVTDGSAIIEGSRVVPSAASGGKVALASAGPAVLGEKVIGFAAEAGGADGTIVLVDVCSPYEIAVS